jgi:hypothetical protein
LPLYLEIAHCRLSSAGEIAYRFVNGIRHPDCAELSGSQQFDQSHGVATVGLDAVAGAFGDHRWRNDITNVTQIRQLSVQSVAGRPSLVAKMQLVVSPTQFCYELLNGVRRIFDFTKIADFAVASVFRNSNRVLLFCAIKGHEGQFILSHGPSSMH